MEVRDVRYGRVTSAVSFTSRSWMFSTEIITGEIVRVGYCLGHTRIDPLLFPRRQGLTGERRRCPRPPLTRGAVGERNI